MTAPVSHPALTTAICHLEHRCWQALCASGPSLIPLLSKNPVMIFPGDILLTANSSPTLHEMLQSPEYRPWKSYKLSHDEVIPLGRDAALIYYRVEAVRDDTVFRALCCSAWVKEGTGEGTSDEEWKMASHQQTLI
ncbi:uncharacterized protein EI97DRAFT_138453 [Westerdykella ornata]|uniref:Uncharacterized protein n=1 Tax=Westerdykella ornata TaxID=318751 RepID=A0A6A6JD46_WESOR|nr:uncharacterized protein EI97DRAFT_138453 [Westerdykella ornata]KAF2273918.1 hypothetical protein EI97DRAFT_138453 [Westerdykella ornata]